MTTDNVSHQQNPRTHQRRYPVGAELVADGVSFRVWAAAQRSVSILLEDGREFPMNHESDGYFRLDVAGLAPGALYRGW